MKMHGLLLLDIYTAADVSGQNYYQCRIVGSLTVVDFVPNAIRYF